MNRKRVIGTCALLTVAACGLFAVARDGAEDKMVNLNDFDWTVTKTRSEASVKRHPAACAFLWGPDKEEFKSDRGTLSVVTLTLTPRKTGRLRLTPEFFMMSAGDNYRLCHGVRVVDPKPGCGEAFFPPSGGRGLEIYYLSVTEGRPIVIELVFSVEWQQGEQILATSPVVTMAKPK
jgi:hypothetical protein